MSPFFVRSQSGSLKGALIDINANNINHNVLSARLKSYDLSQLLLTTGPHASHSMDRNLLAVSDRGIGTYAFVEGRPHRRMAGIPVVMQGHRLACGCHGVAGIAVNVRVE